MKANKGLIVFVFLVIHPFYAARAKKKKKKLSVIFFFLNMLGILVFLIPWVPGPLIFGEQRWYFRKYITPSPSSFDGTFV